MPCSRQNARTSASQPRPRVAAVLDVRRPHLASVEQLAQLAAVTLLTPSSAPARLELLHRAPRLAVVAAAGRRAATGRAARSCRSAPRRGARASSRTTARPASPIGAVGSYGSRWSCPSRNVNLVWRNSSSRGTPERARSPRPTPCLVVVLALVRGVDRAKAGCKRGPHAVRGRVFLPRRAVHQRGRHAVIVSATVAACMSMPMRSARS